MKEKIMQLRQAGLSYKAISNQLSCSKSLVNYYCVDDQENSKTRRNKRRDENPGLEAVERFSRKKSHCTRRFKAIPTIKDVREKVRSFRRREGSKVTSIKEGAIFTYHKMLEVYADQQRCYLTGRPIDLMNTNTYSLDHIIPATRGGDNSFENMGIACPQANWAKSDMTLDEFVQLCVEVVENFGGSLSVKPTTLRG